ncbi:efflux transporter periplasmic adaptor subunit [Paenibacillus hemerocallicola]|uniref:Efflux transporter periplasmic adaptor subunit n=1 Tax=Paenibacillus hemerocallicola TaxID=1172614 RepID=A0A5C4TGF1_9BACL|nr:efflux transporter periplasmic adaptor subunit [Paenibacillus hemerocallicola]TNJ68131.1 efflux transporter periplasmic adaptor subunit [Paenibacillus hemerocallicola]
MSTKGKSFASRACIAVLLVAACSGCSLIPKEDEPLKPPLVKPVKENYQIADVKSGSVTKRITGVATVESTNVKNHEFTGTTGKIQEILIIKDAMVKQGDPLITLDAGDSAIVLKERERDYEQAKYNLDQAKLTQDENKMKIRVMELDIAKLRLSDARAAVEGKTMRAQMDGRITFVDTAKPGDTVQANKTYVIISDPNSIRLAYTSGNTSDLLEVQAGVSVDVTVKGKKMVGKVVQSPSNTPPTDNKQLADKYAKTIFIDVPNPTPDMTLGSTADINIVTRKKDNVLIIPARALAQYLGRNYVKVLEGDSIKEVDVEKGLETVDGIEIVKGLKEGQKLILQ